MKTSTAIVIVLALVGVTLVLGIGLGWRMTERGADGPKIVIHSTGLRIEEVRKLASLTVLRVPITDVQNSEIQGYTGGVSAVLLVRGDVDIAADLQQARWESMDEQGKKAVLVLPQPATSRPRLDHEKTRIYRVERNGLWALLPGEAGEAQIIDRAMQQAQGLLEKAAGQPDLIAQARHHAEEVICPFFAALGWSVEIRWVP